MKNMDFEYYLPLTADPHLFIGEKSVAVSFEAENVSVNVKSWRDVYWVILTRCNQNAEHHKTLMYLRNKVGGK